MSRSLFLAAVTSIGIAASAASAGAIQYSMTWNSVSGTYGSTSLSGARLTLTFSYDTDNLTTYSGYDSATFINGSGITATLVNDASGTPSTILNDVALDNHAGNSSAIVHTGGSVYFGTLSGGSYSQDRGSLRDLTGSSAADAMTTAWSSSTSTASITGAFNAYYLTIAGSQLSLNEVNNVGGSWSSTLASTPAVPGVGGMAAIAGVGLAGRRRRR